MTSISTVSVKRIGTLGWMFFALFGLLNAQPTLQITSPTDGTIVFAGESVTVTVAASGGVFQQVYIVGYEPIGVTQPLAAPPYQFTISIPDSIPPGEYLLTAHGYTAPGHGARSESVHIVVERPAGPISLRAEPSLLHLSLGHKGYLRVVGVFGDGSTTDLTKSSRTMYTSDHVDVATVQAQGIVTAVAPGTARIIIANGKAKIEVPVTVVGNSRP